MSRLRRFNQKVLREDYVDSDDDGDVTFLPLDTEEQEQLVNKFEICNATKNERYVQILSIMYLLCCGIFLLLVVGGRRKDNGIAKHRRILFFCINSMVCSMVNLRYEVVNNFWILGRYRLIVTNQKINGLNCMLIVMTLWLVSDQVETRSLKVLFTLPLLLFGISVIVKHWLREMEEELGELRVLKYKYKNA